jgi:nicotinamidase-related amidase
MSTWREVTRLNAQNAALVVVDIQEKLIHAVQEEARLVKSCETLIKGCRILGLPILYTQQYTKGLGPTIPSIIDAATVNMDDPAGSAPTEFAFIDKTSFSVMGEPAFQKQWKTHGKPQAIVCGIEAHVCVLQSVFDMLDKEFDVFLACDAVSSRSASDCANALNRAAAEGAVVTTVETILFELMKDAGHPKFKEVSKLIK